MANLVHDENYALRDAALRAIREMGPAAVGYASVLIKFLEQEKAEASRTTIAHTIISLGPEVKAFVPDLIKLLNHDDANLRVEAARALCGVAQHLDERTPVWRKLLLHRDSAVRQLGLFYFPKQSGAEHKEYIVTIIKMLTDEESLVRDAALQTLKAMEEHTKDQVPELISLLDHPLVDARGAAAVLLGNLGTYPSNRLATLFGLLVDGDFRDRSNAQSILSNLRSEDVQVETGLSRLLHHPSGDVRAAVLRTLFDDEEYAREHVSTLTNMLTDPHYSVRYFALNAFKELGETAKDQAGALAALLNHDEGPVRRLAVQGLVVLGAHANDYFGNLAWLLKDPDASVRKEALFALGEISVRPEGHASEVIAMLNDQAPSVREQALRVLKKMGPRVRRQVASELPVLLADNKESVSKVEIEALLDVGPMPVDAMVPLLALSFRQSLTATGRFLLHFLGNARPEVETILARLGDPKPNLLDEQECRRYHKNNVMFNDWREASTAGTPHIKIFGFTGDGECVDRTGREALEVFRTIWGASEPYKNLRTEIARVSANIVTVLNWSSADRDLLTWWAKQLQEERLNVEATAVLNEIDELEAARLPAAVMLGLGVHALFWLCLILVYPQSRLVQALFFWDRRVRWFAGFGYVGFLIVWIPLLRQRLFTPFREALLADVSGSLANEGSYFEGSVVCRGDGVREPVIDAIPRIRGQMVLEGESGLGKTMFLRHLAKNYPGLVVFLRATDCGSGVVEAVQSKLEGPARDLAYLRQLIYAGALDVVIDGVNEATHDTRGVIVDFARRFARGNLLLVTQPMLWEPPALAVVYQMERLNFAQIREFLQSRFKSAENPAHTNETAYGILSQKFLSKVLEEGSCDKERESARRVLSNPMDLSIISEMLVAEKTPNLFELQSQYYRNMADECDRLSGGMVPFPLKEFSEYVYRMRTKDQLAMSGSKFSREISVMVRYKMLVPHSLGSNFDSLQSWRFRHEKIMDFFLAQALLGKGNRRLEGHFGDPRFRGTFFQLANLLPIEQARVLERHIVDYAAESKDHSVSDEFVKLLRERSAAMGSRRPAVLSGSE